MSETEDLKEWIKIHFSDYDKSRFDLYLKEKKAYNDGIATFDSMQYELPPELKIELRHESGLMEVARQRGFLFEYGYHAYRQIELVFTNFFEVSPGRNAVGEYLLGTDESVLNLHYSENHRNDQIQLQAIVNTAVQNIVNYIQPTHSSYAFNKFNLVRKVNNYRLINSNRWVFEEKPIRLFFKDKERLYKSAMFYNPFNPNDNKSNPAKVFSWPNLNAFEIVNHSRNKYAHLGIENSDIESVYNDSRLRLTITNQEQNFINDPASILQSDYIERYINMVVGLYSELHKVNYDLNVFHT